MTLLKLQHKSLGLYFCTAAFCHVALFSSLYDWSKAPTAGVVQASSTTTYFYPMLVVENTGNQTQSKDTDNNGRSLASLRMTAKKQGSGNFSQETQDDIHSHAAARMTAAHSTPDHQGYSALLSALHSAIERQQVYPASALNAGQSGTAIVDFSLSPDGTISHSLIRQSSGYPNLDRAALAAVQAITPFKKIGIANTQACEVAVSFSVTKGL